MDVWNAINGYKYVGYLNNGLVDSFHVYRTTIVKLFTLLYSYYQCKILIFTTEKL
jgi:hypothetical protein